MNRERIWIMTNEKICHHIRAEIIFPVDTEIGYQKSRFTIMLPIKRNIWTPVRTQVSSEVATLINRELLK
jgi:hypothetical protein